MCFFYVDAHFRILIWKGTIFYDAYIEILFYTIVELMTIK